MLQEIPEVQVIERTQEQIGEQIGDILVLQSWKIQLRSVQIIPQEHLQQHIVDHEQVIAGEKAQNIVGFHSVPGQVKIQEFPEVPCH